jgi:MFS family permease
VQLPTVRFIRRVGTAGALVVGSLGYLIAYGGVSAASGYLSLFACVLCATLCEIVAVPAHQARLTALAPVDNVAGYAGIAGLVQGLAQTTGPLIGSFLVAFVPAGLGWVAIALFGIAAALGFRRQSATP